MTRFNHLFERRFGVAGDIMYGRLRRRGVQDLAFFSRDGEWITRRNMQIIARRLVFATRSIGEKRYPAPCDFDGDCKFDLAVFVRGSNWYYPFQHVLLHRLVRAERDKTRRWRFDATANPTLP